MFMLVSGGVRWSVTGEVYKGLLGVVGGGSPVVVVQKGLVDQKLSCKVGLASKCMMNFP